MDIGQALAAAAAALVVGLYPQARGWDIAVKVTPPAMISVSACRAQRHDIESQAPAPIHAGIPDALILSQARGLR